ncbi:hypothetical protein, partial [Nostoc sp. UIC 10630]|uniref:NACHT C-terminal alpha/beta 1 domain-containing protein n=1 Tax=Nostoc sp. UIC 10630 TaxID=2100146 RepID=UPI0013FC3B11
DKLTTSVNLEITLESLIEQISNSQNEHELDEAFIKLINIINRLSKIDFIKLLQTLKKRLDFLSSQKLVNLENTSFSSILWYCAQNIAYVDFHNIWHQEKSEPERIKSEQVSLKYFALPHALQVALNNDSQLNQNIHLICIDTSKFIDPDNPASRIYAAIVKAGCPKYQEGIPKTMVELQTYWDLLETDKQVVLLFYSGTTNITGGVTYSNTFLNSISRFEGKICFISDLILNCNTLQVFTPNQSVDEILEWLRCS